jgi:hypothetical protein
MAVILFHVRIDRGSGWIALAGREAPLKASFIDLYKK